MRTLTCSATILIGSPAQHAEIPDSYLSDVTYIFQLLKLLSRRLPGSSQVLSGHSHYHVIVKGVKKCQSSEDFTECVGLDGE